MKKDRNDDEVDYRTLEPRREQTVHRKGGKASCRIGA